MGDVVARHVLLHAKDSSIVALGHRDSQLDGLVPFGYLLATAKYAFTLAELLVFGMWPSPNTVFVCMPCGLELCTTHPTWFKLGSSLERRSETECARSSR